MFIRRKGSKRDNAPEADRRKKDSSRSLRRADSTVSSTSSRKDRHDGREPSERHSRSSRNDRRENREPNLRDSPPASTVSKRRSRSSRQDSGDAERDYGQEDEDGDAQASIRDPRTSRQRSIPSSVPQRDISPSRSKRDPRENYLATGRVVAPSDSGLKKVSERPASSKVDGKPKTMNQSKTYPGKQKERLRAGEEGVQTSTSLVPHNEEVHEQHIHDSSAAQAYPQLQSNIANQFPDQTPLYHAIPYLPGRFNPHGEAADYYGDQGESVANQPGVRPGTPIIIGAEPHLLPASAEPAPPQETGAGTAAEFFASEELDAVTPSSHPTQNVHYHSPRISPATSPRPSKPSRPNKFSGKLTSSSALGAATAAAVGISALNHHYSSGHSSSHPSNHVHHTRPPESSANSLYAPPSQVLHHTSLPQNHSSYQHELYAIGNEDKGAFAKFIDWWNDYEDVRKMEEYTEFIGVCKYCFDRNSSPWQAPRPHHPHRVRSRDSIENVRIDKQRRYQGVATDHVDSVGRRHKRNATWLGAGLGAYGVAKFFGAGSDSESSSERSGQRRHASAVQLRRPSRERLSSIHGSAATPVMRRQDSREGMTMVGGPSSNALVRRRRSRDGVSTVEGHPSMPHVSRSSSEQISSQLIPPSLPLTRSERDTAVSAGGFVGGAGARSHRDTRSKHGETEAEISLLPSDSLKETFDQSRHRPSGRLTGRVPQEPPNSHNNDTRWRRSSSSMSNSSRSSSGDSKTGFLGRVFGTPKKRSRRYSSPQRGDRRRNESLDDFVFGEDRYSSPVEYSKHSKPRLSRRPRRSSDERAKIAIAGLGTAAAALAAHEAGKTHNRLRNGKGNAHTGLAPSPRRPAQSVETVDDDAWESATDEYGDSDDSGLAFGTGHVGKHLSARASSESLSSVASRGTARKTTDKWDWRWDPKHRKAPPKRESSAIDLPPPLVALGKTSAAEAGPAAQLPRPMQPPPSQRPTGGALRRASTEPLQYLDPFPDDDPANPPDVAGEGTFPSPKPLIRAMTDSVPLKQPQPVQPAHMPPEPVNPPMPIRRVSFADAPTRRRAQSIEDSDSETPSVDYPPKRPAQEAKLTQPASTGRPRKSPAPSPDQWTSDEADSPEAGEAARGRRLSSPRQGGQHHDRNAAATAVTAAAVGAAFGATLKDRRKEQDSPELRSEDEGPVQPKRKQEDAAENVGEVRRIEVEPLKTDGKDSSSETTPFPQLPTEDHSFDQAVVDDEDDEGRRSRAESPPTTRSVLPSRSTFQVRRPAQSPDSSDDDQHEKFHPDFFKRKRKAAADARDDKEASDVLADWTEKWSQNATSAPEFFAPEELRNRPEQEPADALKIDLDGEDSGAFFDEQKPNSKSSRDVPRLNLIAPTPPRSVSGASERSPSPSPLRGQPLIHEDEEPHEVEEKSNPTNTDSEARKSPLPVDTEPESGRANEFVQHSETAEALDSYQVGPQRQETLGFYQQPVVQSVSDVDLGRKPQPVSEDAIDLKPQEEFQRPDLKPEEAHAGTDMVNERTIPERDGVRNDAAEANGGLAMAAPSSKRKSKKKASKVESRWASLAALATGAAASVALEYTSEHPKSQESPDAGVVHTTHTSANSEHEAENTHKTDDSSARRSVSFRDEPEMFDDQHRDPQVEITNTSGKPNDRHVPGSFDEFDTVDGAATTSPVQTAEENATPAVPGANVEDEWSTPPATSKKSKKQKKRDKRVSWEAEDKVYDHPEDTLNELDASKDSPPNIPISVPTANSDATTQGHDHSLELVGKSIEPVDDWASQSSKSSKKSKKQKRRSAAPDFDEIEKTEKPRAKDSDRPKADQADDSEMTREEDGTTFRKQENGVDLDTTPALGLSKKERKKQKKKAQQVSWEDGVDEADMSGAHETGTGSQLMVDKVNLMHPEWAEDTF